jgi:hypothetical protein
MVTLAGNDEQRAPVGVLGVDFGLGPGVEVRGRAWKTGSPEPGTANSSERDFASSSPSALAKAYRNWS